METGTETRRNVPQLFGSAVFNDDVMQERLPKDVYKSLERPSTKEKTWTWPWPTPWPTP